MNATAFLDNPAWWVWPTETSNQVRFDLSRFDLSGGQRQLGRNLLLSTDALSQRANKVLGKSGAKRFEEFKEYQTGWDSGAGRALSLRSVAVMESFLNQAQLDIREPSLFFTRAGNLQLGWEGADGSPIELEFYPNKIEYYIGQLSIEGEVFPNDHGITELTNKLGQAS